MDKANDRTEGRIVAQLQVVAARDVEGAADGLEGLGLLDRVNAQVGFHVEVKVEHLQRIAGLLSHDGQHLVHDRVGGRSGSRYRLRHGHRLGRGHNLWRLRRGRDDGLRNRLRRGHRRDDGRSRGRGLLRLRRGDGLAVTRRHGGRRSAVGGRGDHSRRDLHRRGLVADQSAQRWPRARLPAVGRGRARRVALGSHAQNALDHFGLDCVVAADVGQPTPVGRLVVHAIRPAGDAAGEG